MTRHMAAELKLAGSVRYQVLCTVACLAGATAWCQVPSTRQWQCSYSVAVSRLSRAECDSDTRTQVLQDD